MIHGEGIDSATMLGAAMTVGSASSIMEMHATITNPKEQLRNEELWARLKAPMLEK